MRQIVKQAVKVPPDRDDDLDEGAGLEDAEADSGPVDWKLSDRGKKSSQVFISLDYNR